MFMLMGSIVRLKWSEMSTLVLGPCHHMRSRVEYLFHLVIGDSASQSATTKINPVRPTNVCGQVCTAIFCMVRFDNRNRLYSSGSGIPIKFDIDGF